MALLDVFDIVFNSDAKDAQKDVEGLGDALGGVEETAGKASEAADTMGDSFINALLSAEAITKGVELLTTAVHNFFDQANATNELGRFADSLDLNVEQLSTWEGALVQSGGSAEDFRGTIKGLTDTLTDMALTGGADSAETFARLGISAFNASGQIKSAFELLPQLADSFEQLSDVQSTNLGQKLGLDEGTILLLQRGRGSIEDLLRRQKELGVTTKEDTELAADFNAAWATIGLQFQQITRTSSLTLLPAMTAILEGLTGIVGFIQDNPEVVTNFFLAAAGIITTVYLPAVLKAVAGTIGMIAPFLLVGIAIAAAAAAIALLVDDIKAFLSGSDSVIGTLSEKWPIIGELVKGIAEAMEGLIEFFSEFIDKLSSGVVSSATDFLKGVGDFLGFGAQAVAETGTTATVAAGLTQNSRSINQSTSVSVDKVNVDARGGNSQEIAAGVGDALKTEMEQAVSTYDDGVMI